MGNRPDLEKTDGLVGRAGGKVDEDGTVEVEAKRGADNESDVVDLDVGVGTMSGIVEAGADPEVVDVAVSTIGMVPEMVATAVTRIDVRDVEGSLHVGLRDECEDRNLDLSVRFERAERPRRCEGDTPRKLNLSEASFAISPRENPSSANGSGLGTSVSMFDRGISSFRKGSSAEFRRSSQRRRKRLFGEGTAADRGRDGTARRAEDVEETAEIPDAS